MDLMKTLLLYMALLLAGASGNDAELPREPVPVQAVETTAPSEAAAEMPAPTAVPTLVPAALKQYETLRSGSKGQNVTRLQQQLEKLGYYNSTVDGSYGKNTKAAVEAFQRDHGLKADGIAGPKTLAALDETVLPGAPETLMIAGSTVQVNGSALTLDWYQDENGCPWVELAAFAEKNGWKAENGVYRTAPAGVRVVCVASGESCLLKVEDTEATDCALAWKGTVYVNAAFFERLGGAAVTDGETLILSFHE